MRRGISPPKLLEWVEGSAPYLFSDPAPCAPYAERLRRARARPEEALGPLDYFGLLLSAHWATAASFVPTDVDNAIRHRLWSLGDPPETLRAMADLVLESLRWDYRPVTARVARAPSGAVLSTHEGTWFSVAVGAYAAMRGLDVARAEAALEAMAAELRREAALLAELEDSGDALESLKAAALLAHNLGDLDRVVDQWELPEGDPLRRRLYKAGQPGALDHLPALARVAELNAAMAPENHRHYPLRAARCLRRRREFLLPVSPFLDDWGARLGDLPRSGLSPEEAGEVARALIDGWFRVPGAVGYSRALAGMLEAFPGGMESLGPTLPARHLRLLRSGPLRVAVDLPRGRFEAQWRKKARPGRAAVSPKAGV